MKKSYIAAIPAMYFADRFFSHQRWVLKMTPSAQSPKSVLITGCSAGGLGAALALAFQKHGYVVFATARSPAKIPTTLTDLPNVHALSLDVTSDESVYAAAKSVKATLTGKGLDVLFNNSGIGYSSSLLDLDLERAKQLYEVNLWGVIRTTQAFADLVIEAKGAIVNQGSISGESYEPFNCRYSSLILNIHARELIMDG